MFTRRTLGIVASLILVVVGFAWLTGGDPVAWWRLRTLARATEAEREAAAGAVADLNERAIPGLLALLRSPDAHTCQNARAGLVCLLRRLPPEDPKLASFVERLAEGFGSLSPAGKGMLLTVGTESLPTRPEDATPAIRAAWTRLLSAIAKPVPEEVRGPGLELAAWLLTPTPGEALPPARELVRECLTAESPALRLRAVQLSLVAGMELEDDVTALLRDPVAEVRRSAMLVVGPAEKSVLDEVLLSCLRDPDPEVKRLCEAALRGRGLTSQHLQLGRLVTDPSPLERIKVLEELRGARDLEPGVWLRRLSHDPADSVRAAAVRGIASETRIDLSERLEQMRTSDPSPTISELAAFYLRRQ